MIFLELLPTWLFFIVFLYLVGCRTLAKFPITSDFEKMESRIKVICMGDSITFGDGVKYRRWYSYPFLLKKILDKKAPQKFVIKNFGKNSSTTTPHKSVSYIDLRFYKQVLKSEASVIVLLLGTNDSKSDIWPGDKRFCENYRSILNALKAMSSEPRIILMLPPKAFKLFEKQKHCLFSIRNEIIEKEIIPSILTIAREESVEVIDLYTQTKKHRNYFSYDGIHPNKRGNKLIAKKVSDLLLQ